MNLTLLSLKVQAAYDFDNLESARNQRTTIWREVAIRYVIRRNFVLTQIQSEAKGMSAYTKNMKVF